MPMPSDPGTALMMVKAKFFLELLVALLNPVSFMIESGKVDCRHMKRHVAEEIAKLIPTLYQWPPFNENPHLFMNSSFPPAACWPHPHGYCLSYQ
jgi:hypothetical protein